MCSRAISLVNSGAGTGWLIYNYKSYRVKDHMLYQLMEILIKEKCIQMGLELNPEVILFYL